jgi:hypothetical protein
MKRGEFDEAGGSGKNEQRIYGHCKLTERYETSDCQKQDRRGVGFGDVWQEGGILVVESRLDQLS